MTPLISWLFMSCRKASELIERQHDHPLTAIESARLAAHLRVCDLCQNYAHQSAQIEKLLHGYVARAEDVAENPELVARILKTLEGENNEATLPNP